MYMSSNTENILLIDSHCHLDFRAFDEDRDEVLANCAQKGISDIVIPGVLASTFDNLIGLCEANSERTSKTPSLHYALGLHPIFLNDHSLKDIDSLETSITKNSPIAVGEIGLDFFVKTLDKQLQLSFFSKQLDIAEQYKLPVILHVRKAHDEVLQLLKARNISGGIAHAFNGSIQQAHQYIDLGFKLGFGGMITYSRSTKLRSLAKNLPLESIVLETDSPDMTVAQYQGQRNSPEYLDDIAKCLSELRCINLKKLASTLSKNAREVLIMK